MPIFVNGQALRKPQSPREEASASSWDDLGQAQLTYTFTEDGAASTEFIDPPQSKNSRKIVNMDAKEALDYVRKTMYQQHQVSVGKNGPLADELSSVGSVSVPPSTPFPARSTSRIAPIRPVRDPPTGPMDPPTDTGGSVATSPPWDDATERDTSGITRDIHRIQGDRHWNDDRHSITMGTSITPTRATTMERDEMIRLDHYDPALHDVPVWSRPTARGHTMPRRMSHSGAYQPTSTPTYDKYARMQQKGLLSIEGPVDDRRQDFGVGREGEFSQMEDREVIHLERNVPATTTSRDERAKTLEDLVALLMKGYRVKLHTFRGRERSFLYLRQDKKSLCLRTEGPLRGQQSLVLTTTIENIANLEFGRRSQSGFVLSPLTSFSLAVIDREIDEGIQHYDLEAASPVQREVLVSTLMIMMDAAAASKREAKSKSGRKVTLTRSTRANKPNVVRSETPRDDSGTYNQPIPCSPSIEAIPCSPSLDAGRTVSFLDPVDETASLDLQNESFHTEEIHLEHKESSFEDDTGSNRLLSQRFEGSLNERFIEETSSGEITDHTSNVSVGISSRYNEKLGVAPSSPVVSGEDLDSPIHSNRASTKLQLYRSFSENGQSILSGSMFDETKESKYIFDQVDDCIFAGSEDRPILIDDEIDPVISSHDSTFTDSVVLSQPSDMGDSGLRLIYSTQSMYSGSSQLHSLDPPRFHEAATAAECYVIEDPTMHSDSKKARESPCDDTNDSGTIENSILESDTVAEMKPKFQMPKIESSQLMGGWCSDDICTGTLNDISKTCTGIFESQQQNQMGASCIDPSLTAEQTAMVEEYIATALGAPNAVYTYFSEGEESDKESTPVPESSPRGPPTPERVSQGRGKKIKNRAVRGNAQADRLRTMKNEMTFAHALKQSQERSVIKTTQSFDDAKLLPQLADRAARKLHSSPLLDSVVKNMMDTWNANEDVFVSPDETAQVTAEEESVYYDSDPEDSRPRTMHKGPRNVHMMPQSNAASVTRPKALDGFRLETKKSKLSKRVDEETVKEIVQSMMNERLLVMWHPTQNADQPNRAPELARLWIESGVYLVDGSFLLPKLSWVKAFGQSLSSPSSSLSPKQVRRGSAGGGSSGSRRSGLTSPSQQVHKIDLLDICRIRVCDQVERTQHPFANGRLAWYVETQSDMYLFESETADERERVVYGLKLVVARLASLLMLRDVRAAEEFFGAVSDGVPGEAPVWAGPPNSDSAGSDPPSSSTDPNRAAGVGEARV